MKTNEIKVGKCYEAKVSNRVVTVRIDSTNSRSGWNATNTATGKRIVIKSAQRLRRAAGRGAAVRAQAVADQQNARLREERAAAPDGPTASERAMSESAGATPAEQGEAAARVTAKKARAKQAAGEPKPKRISALDAAAQVLQAAGKPMRTKELIAAMAERKLWASANGKTPEATLYSAILREITTKGTQARFRKVERGQFAFNG